MQLSNKINSNLILILAIITIVSVPIAYAVVEPSIIINMDAGQTTKPLLIKDSIGTEVFAVDTAGTITTGNITNKAQLNSAIVYTDQANTFGTFAQTFSVDTLTLLDATGDPITILSGTQPPPNRRVTFPTLAVSVGEFLITNVGQTITSSKIFNDAVLFIRNPADTASYAFRSSAIVANRDISLPLLTADDTFAVLGLPQTLNFKTLTNAVIDCSLNTCTNLPSGSYSVFGSRFNIITPTNTVFNFPSGQSGDSGNETEMVMIMTTSGTIDRLHFKYISNSLDIPTTVTVRKNFADTSLTLSNPASSSALQSDLVNSFTFVAGDEISITMITGAGTGQGTKPYWSFEITS